ncbi:hypothetical protein Tco_0424887 [Tanacetum coccineum]
MGVRRVKGGRARRVRAGREIELTCQEERAREVGAPRLFHPYSLLTCLSGAYIFRFGCGDGMSGLLL